MVVVLDASYGQKKLSTQENYIPSPNAPRPHKQTTPPTTNTRNGPVAPQYRIPTSNIPNCASSSAAPGPCLPLPSPLPPVNLTITPFSCYPPAPPPTLSRITIPIISDDLVYHSVHVLPTHLPCLTQTSPMTPPTTLFSCHPPSHPSYPYHPRVTSPTDTAPANCSSPPKIPKLSCDTKGYGLPGKINSRK